MDEQEDIQVKEGITKIVDEQGQTLVTIELTPNMVVILSRDGTPIMRVWRKVLQFLESLG